MNYRLFTALSLMFLFGFGDFSHASTVIFSDGFESDFSEWTGNDEKWTTSATSSETGVHSGLKRAQVTGNTEPGDDVLLKSISTAGIQAMTIEFWYRVYKGLEEADHVYLEWSVDDSNWHILNDFTTLDESATWEFASYPIPAEADDKVNFAIRFRAVLGALSSDVFYLDDVALSGNNSNPTPTPTPTPDITPTPTPEPTPTPTPEPSESPTPIPTPSITPTPAPPTPTPATPTPTPTPASQVIASSSLVPTKTPPPPPSATRTPISTPLASPEPLAKAGAPTKTPSPALLASPKPVAPSVLSSSVAIDFQESESDSSSESVELLENLELPEKPQEVIVESSSLFASIAESSGSKSFWLLGTMVLAVVFSSAKFKKD